jgi:hypothetical protein
MRGCSIDHHRTPPTTYPTSPRKSIQRAVDEQQSSCPRSSSLPRLCVRWANCHPVILTTSSRRRTVVRPLTWPVVRGCCAPAPGPRITLCLCPRCPAPHRPRCSSGHSDSVLGTKHPSCRDALSDLRSKVDLPPSLLSPVLVFACAVQGNTGPAANQAPPGTRGSSQPPLVAHL